MADSLRQIGHTAVDCAAELTGLALYIRYASPDSDTLEGILQALNCDVVGYHVPYNIGARYYMLQDYQAAQTWLSRSLSAAPDHAHELRCRIALGAICSEMDDRPGALEHFSRAHEIAEPPVPLMLVNNLASTQIWFDLHDEALQLVDAALTRKDLSEAEQSLLRTNRFLALFRSNRLTETREEFNSLFPQLQAEEISASLFINLVHYALRQENQEIWLDLEDRLEQALAQISPPPFRTNEPCRMLFSSFDAEWNALGIEDIGDSRWRTIKGLQAAYEDAMETLYSSQRDEATYSQYEKLHTDSLVASPEQDNYYWAWLLLIVLGLGGAGVAIQVRKKSQSQASAPSSVDHLIQDDASHEHPHEITNSLDVMRSAEIEKHQIWLKAIVASTCDLTETEFHALELFVHGHSAKEAAVKLDKSVGHVYNLRTTLRKKLDLDSNEDFSNWYQSQLSLQRLS